MPKYIVTHCNVEDGPAMGENNMSAFWGDPNWVIVCTSRNPLRAEAFTQHQLLSV
jgi:hypothetical protein